MPTSIAARVVMQGLSDTLYKAGYTIGKATSMTAVYQRHLQACIAASDDLSPIERLTGTEQAAMLLQNPTLHISSRLAQRAWPWKDMEVWDKVVIPANLAREGQRAVHSYAAGTNKLFSTRRTATGALTVVRMPGVRRARL